MSLHGSCLCGGVRYRLEPRVLGTNVCHCRQCRKASGTAFATNAAVPRNALQWLAGTGLLKTFRSSPGKERVFCLNCGSPLYSRFDDRPEVIFVRIGTLDDEMIAPDVHIHVASKAPWFDILDDLPQRREEEDLWF